MFKNLLIVSFMIPLLCHDICAQDLLTTGARPLGMGGVFTSIADDANTVFWNAAGLPRLQRIEASGTHAKLWNAQIINQQAILVFPFTGKFALGLGLNNIRLVDDEQLDFHQTVFNGALGYQLCPFLALGANLKYLDFGAGLNSASTVSLFKESEAGFGFDAGLLLSWPHNDSSRFFLKDFQVGFTVRDIRDTDIKFDSGAEDKVFLESYRVGLAWTPAQKRIFGLPSLPVLAFEFNPEARWHLGGELSLITGPKGFLRRLSLRAGAQNDWHPDEGATYSFGGGFRVALGSIGLLQVDYAYIYPPSLPPSRKYGFSFLFKTPYNKVKRIGKVKDPTVYPSLIKRYEKIGLTQITLKNERNEVIEGKLIVRADGDLYKTSTRSEQIAPKDSVTWNVVPSFNTGQLFIIGDERVPYSITYLYRFQDGLQDSVRFDGFIDQRAAPAIRWDDYRKAAAFITPDDPAVSAFVTQLRDHFDASRGQQFPSIHIAMQLFDGMKAAGIKYRRDELDTHYDLAADSSTYFPQDKVTYPSILLAGSLSGDCDDLTVLYCSLLANAGIETALIDVPEHIYMMFDTGIPSEPLLHPFETEHMIERHGRFWMPVEITSIDSGFVSAWLRGVRHYKRLQQGSGLVKVADVNKAWVHYPPVAMGNDDRSFSFSNQQLDNTVNLTKSDISKLGHLQQTFIAEAVGSTLEDAEKRHKLNERGLAYIGFGVIDSLDLAKQAFVRLLESTANDPKALNNLGNLLFLQNDLRSALEKYEEALAMDESVIGVHLNLAQVHYDLSRNFADTSKAHQEHIAAYARHMKFIRDNVDGYEEVLKLINIPIESSEGTKGDRWADVVSGFEDFKTRLLGFFVDDRPVEYIWRLDDGSFFESGEEKSIRLNLRIDKEGLDPLKGDFFAEGNRYSSKRREVVDLNGPSTNMALKIEPVTTSKEPAISKQYLLTLKNISESNETLDLIVIKYRAEPGISILESKPTVDEQRVVTPEDRKKPVASEEGVRVVSGGKRFGIEERHYLFWYN